MIRPPAGWLTGVFQAPLVLGALVALIVGGVPGVLIAVLLLTLAVQCWRGSVGKYPGLCLALISWIGALSFGAMMAAAVIAPWGVCCLVAGAVTALITFVACRIAMPWGYERATRRALRGDPIREWEWVYTGREFALGHPMSRLGVSIYLTAGFVLLQWGLGARAVYLMPESALSWTVFAIFTLLTPLTLVSLFKRSPAAWVLVWIHLICSFPLSLPLVFYWADGVRPNLIYRHRFERLVPLKTMEERDV